MPDIKTGEVVISTADGRKCLVTIVTIVTIIQHLYPGKAK